MGKLTPEKKDSILRTYEREKEYKKTAEIEHVKWRAVKNTVEDAKRNQKASQEKTDQQSFQQWMAYESYDKGVTVIQVCIKFHIDEPTAEQALVSFWRAKRLDLLVRAYHENKEDGFKGLLDLKEKIDEEGLGATDVVDKFEEVEVLEGVNDEIGKAYSTLEGIQEKIRVTNDKMAVREQQWKQEERDREIERQSKVKRLEDLSWGVRIAEEKIRRGNLIPVQLLTEEGRMEALAFMDRHAENIVLKPRSQVMVNNSILAVIRAVRENPSLLSYIQRGVPTQAGLDKAEGYPWGLREISADVNVRLMEELREKVIMHMRCLAAKSAKPSLSVKPKTTE